MAEQRCAFDQILCFEKQLAKGWMREIIGRARQDNFGVAGDIDLADPFALIDDRYPTHLDIVFGRHRDVELGGDLVVVATERGPLRAELDHVVVRLRRRGMVRGRPHRPAPHVPQVDGLAARVARRVISRLGDREAAAEATAPPRVGHGRHVVTIRQELRMRKDRVR